MNEKRSDDREYPLTARQGPIPGLSRQHHTDCRYSGMGSRAGRSEVWQTSFSISEEFLRRLFFIEKSGAVSRFSLILDHKATNKTLSLWAFISQVIENTYLADNHSKVLLVKSESGDTVSVITSQNLTRGNRFESTLIATDKALFSTLQSRIEEMIKNHSVPLYELLTQRIGAD